jgi:hypothetical protein
MHTSYSRDSLCEHASQVHGSGEEISSLNLVFIAKRRPETQQRAEQVAALPPPVKFERKGKNYSSRAGAQPISCCLVDEMSTTFRMEENSYNYMLLQLLEPPLDFAVEAKLHQG